MKGAEGWRLRDVCLQNAAVQKLPVSSRRKGKSTFHYNTIFLGEKKYRTFQCHENLSPPPEFHHGSRRWSPSLLRLSPPDLSSGVKSVWWVFFFLLWIILNDCRQLAEPSSRSPDRSPASPSCLTPMEVITSLNAFIFQCDYLMPPDPTSDPRPPARTCLNNLSAVTTRPAIILSDYSGAGKKVWGSVKWRLDVIHQDAL